MIIYLKDFCCFRNIWSLRPENLGKKRSLTFFVIFQSWHQIPPQHNTHIWPPQLCSYPTNRSQITVYCGLPTHERMPIAPIPAWPLELILKMFPMMEQLPKILCEHPNSKTAYRFPHNGRTALPFQWWLLSTKKRWKENQVHLWRSMWWVVGWILWLGWSSYKQSLCSLQWNHLRKQKDPLWEVFPCSSCVQRGRSMASTWRV